MDVVDRPIFHMAFGTRGQQEAEPNAASFYLLLFENARIVACYECTNIQDLTQTQDLSILYICCSKLISLEIILMILKYTLCLLK